jgi:hypothetical protein
MTDLLKEWCDGLLRMQLRDPKNPAVDGRFQCPACTEAHGRCGDAVYPLLHMANVTGDSRYLDAGVAAVNWLKNVDSPDGAWTNDLTKNSWKGITVFASIAQAEAIEHHGDLLDKETKERWLARLRRAADFIHDNFTMHFGNINYGITGAYAMALLGRLFNEEKYSRKGRELAHDGLKFMTKNHLIFGEAHPQEELSPRGFPAVDLGYNVEETLPSLALYALLEQDSEVLEAAEAALLAHLEFMLPDGGWDNSWGTRSYKWTYWGSRTSDGCQPAYILLADKHPAFATAALRNTRVMRACTHDGLLHGGPHYFAHQMPACVHHTFTHAKAITKVLEDAPDLDKLNTTVPLPRETASGVREFPEIGTSLIARGPWRGTVTCYDRIYRTMHATGGALAVLYHEDAGTLFAASLAKYEMPERNNMQPLPDDLDFPITPRIETLQNGEWFTNLWNLNATVTHEEATDGILFRVQTRLLDANHKSPSEDTPAFDVRYHFTDECVTISARPVASMPKPWRLVLPLVSQVGEEVTRFSETKYGVRRRSTWIFLESGEPLQILHPERERVFNNVPGFEAVPFAMEGVRKQVLECTLRVKLHN